MRALVTGASGFVGPYLLQHLAACGDHAVGAGFEDGPDLLDGPGWEQLILAHQPDVIYHLAGWSDVGASWTKPHESFRLNAEGTLNVLLGARALNEARSQNQIESRNQSQPGSVRVIVVSSADVYGTVGPEDLPLTETSPVKPRSPYGASKEVAESLARQFQRGFAVDTVIARPFNHVGPGQSPNFAVPAFARRIAECELNGGGSVSHGDLDVTRDFTDVRDVVKAYRLLAECGVSGDTYNICSGVENKIADVLKALTELATVPITTQPDPALMRPVELKFHRGSHARITQISGWEPTIDFQETLADVLAEARKIMAAESPEQTGNTRI